MVPQTLLNGTLVHVKKELGQYPGILTTRFVDNHTYSQYCIAHDCVTEIITQLRSNPR